MTPSPPDVRTILSPAQIARMRADYDRRAFVSAGRAATTSSFPEAAPFFEALLGGFFDDTRTLDAAERELVILALFAGTTPAWMLAVHVYVGLMEGLGVEKIAGAVLLAAMYRHGAAAYTDAITVVERTLSVLRRLAEEAGDATKTPFVLAAIRREHVAR